MPESPDRAVFVLTTTTDGQTDYITPCCACARGVITSISGVGIDGGILKHGTDRTGPDRTNTLIRGTDRTDRGVVMGVF